MLIAPLMFISACGSPTSVVEVDEPIDTVSPIEWTDTGFEWGGEIVAQEGNYAVSMTGIDDGCNLFRDKKSAEKILSWNVELSLEEGVANITILDKEINPKKGPFACQIIDNGFDCEWFGEQSKKDGRDFVLFNSVGWRADWISNIELVGELYILFGCNGPGCEELRNKSNSYRPLSCETNISYESVWSSD